MLQAIYFTFSFMATTSQELVRPRYTFETFFISNRYANSSFQVNIASVSVLLCYALDILHVFTSLCSVTCFSESLRCMCHPKYQETKYRIAAKATPHKTVAKAGHTLDAKLVAAPLVSALLGDGQEKKDAVTGALVKGAAEKWRDITQVWCASTYIPL